MRVLITGHLGYIGPLMVRHFKHAGHFVGGLDTGFFRDSTALNEEYWPDVEIIKDIRLIDEPDVEGFDCVVHLAALSNDPMGELSSSLTMQINYEASLRAARLAKMARVERFIFASSCSLYGAADTSEALTEEAPLNPVSTYAVSKAKTESALRDLADDCFTPVYLRNATAYGVSPRMRLDLVLNNLMAWAKLSGCIRVTSDGTPWRPLVHIEDICGAALCAAQAPKAIVHNQAFNVGRQDCNHRIVDIAEAVAREVRDARVEITGDTAGDLRSYRVSFDKIHKELPEYTPQWTIERGCRELRDWFDSRNETVTSFQSGRYIRLKHLKTLISEHRVSQSLFWTDAQSKVAEAAYE